MDYLAKSFEGKVGIVSGAGEGQGKAVVKLLLEHGANVIAYSRSGNKPTLKHENLKVLKGDSTAPQTLEGIREEVERKYGILHFLYNNHGRFAPGSPSFDGETALEFFKGNVVTSINSINAFWPLMKNGGSIVNVGASKGLFRLASLEYAIAKYSVEELTRKAASSLRDRNIRVNAILPASVDSSTEVEDLLPFKFKELKGKKDVSTLEIAYTALFLLSDLSHGINGQAISVDNGYGGRTTSS